MLHTALILLFWLQHLKHYHQIVIFISNIVIEKGGGPVELKTVFLSPST